MNRLTYQKIVHRKLSEAPKLNVGDVVGRLTVRALAEPVVISGSKRKVWVCECECGTIKNVMDQALRSLMTLSCGCLASEFLALTLPSRKEKKKQTKTYMAWRDMLQRVLNPTNKSFKHYGGRGITVDPSWRSFDKFMSDMGEAPAGMTLERIDNDKGYSGDNCRWAPMKDQQRNKRTNRLVEIDGIVKCVTQWAEEYGLNEHTIRARLRRGLTGRDIVKEVQRVR